MINPDTNSPEYQKELNEKPLLTHLLELRQRLLWSVITLVVLTLCLLPFANVLYGVLSQPLLSALPEGNQMIATEVASAFFAPLKLTVFCALILGFPFLLHQAWAFISPALYLKEKKFAVPLLVSSIVLFYAGIAFAYFVVFPLVFPFMVKVAPDNVAIMTDINHYLNFSLKIFFAFGVAFEVPIATFLIIASGLVSQEKLSSLRPYIIVIAFVVAMLLTPPDPSSQVLLAIPMYLLFELGLILSRLFLSPSSENPKD